MVRGIYTALMGMLVDQAIVDNTANNLANVDTTGYKKDSQAFRSYLQYEILRVEPERGRQKLTALGTLERGVTLDEVRTDQTQGAVESTEVNTDFALQGDGFFSIEGKSGESYFSRNGNGKIDAQGFLTNSNGDYFLNDAGDRILFSSNTVVDRVGNIIQDGVIQGRLAVVRFENPRYLIKSGYTYFRATEQSGVAQPDLMTTVHQGFEEKATVNAVREMINLINAQKHFDLNQKVIMTQDALMDSAINKVGTSRA